MTTDTTNTNAAVIAAALTTGEIDALKMVNASKVLPPYENELPFTLLEQLARMHLVVYFNTSKGFSANVTPLGREVLAHLEATPAATARPEAIAWSEFKNNSNPIFQAWLADQCIVRFSERKIELILSEKSVKLEDWVYEQIMLDHYLLHIKWLTATTQPAPQAGTGGFVNPTRAYEETLTRDELLARLDDQARIIHELYTGKHGVIPHPSEVWQAGLWEVYKVDEYQGHAERVGDVGELAQLRRELAASRERATVAVEALLTKDERETLELINSNDDVDLDIFDRLVERGLIVHVTTLSDSGEAIYQISDLAREALQSKDAASESEVGK